MKQARDAARQQGAPASPEAGRGASEDLDEANFAGPLPPAAAGVVAYVEGLAAQAAAAEAARRERPQFTERERELSIEERRHEAHNAAWAARSG
ncbi:hypothetical protein ABZ070_36730 [Streptomyces sp. NPDC006283]|uniref:hypothetical protein n=1 Tax=Streptomyces sp. NPDC006283 TaxID=3156741 RepID=UPI0033BF6DF5